MYDCMILLEREIEKKKRKKKQRTAPAETVDINSANAAVVAIKRFILSLFFVYIGNRDENE